MSTNLDLTAELRFTVPLPAGMTLTLNADQVMQMHERLAFLAAQVQALRNVPNDNMAHIKALWLSGHKIDAIRQYRADFGATLKDSKDACERLAATDWG